MTYETNESVGRHWVAAGLTERTRRQRLGGVQPRSAEFCFHGGGLNKIAQIKHRETKIVLPKNRWRFSFLLRSRKNKPGYNRNVFTGAGAVYSTPQSASRHGGMELPRKLSPFPVLAG